MQKYLTDIRITQSKIWQRNTYYVGSLGLRCLQALRKLGRYDAIIPFLHTLKICLHHRSYDVIIIGNPRTAQLVTFIKKIFCFSTPRLIVLELMLDEAKEGVVWKIKRKIQQFIFSSIDLIFVSSTSEVVTYSQRLRLPMERIRFLPFHTNFFEMKIVDGKGNYLLSAGKTGRDFKVLAEAASELTCDVVIVSDECSIKGINLPSNVKLLINIPYSIYLELLYGCKAVVVPLKKLVKSTGQVAILEAMALGKPVIATETVGTIDYIKHKYNGILVPPDDPKSLKDAILDILTDESLFRDLSVNAVETVRKFNTFEAYVDTILKAAKEVAQTQ